MQKIRKEFITNPEFDPAKVANASSAAEGLCKWCMAMEIYDRVAKVVAPKKAKLKEAEDELSSTMKTLNTKRAELAAVEKRLADLKATFKEMTEKKAQLEFQVGIHVVGLSNCSIAFVRMHLSYETVWHSTLFIVKKKNLESRK